MSFTADCTSSTGTRRSIPNYYFNTLTSATNPNGLPRDRIILNQMNGRLGGPIWRNKAFFFFAWEEFRLPQTYGSPTQTILTDQARHGDFRYFSGGQIRSVNLYSLAANRGFTGTPDPTIASQLNLISQLTSRAGTIQTQGTSDLNRNLYTFQTPGNSIRHSDKRSMLIATLRYREPMIRAGG